MLFLCHQVFFSSSSLSKGSMSLYLVGFVALLSKFQYLPVFSTSINRFEKKNT